MKTKRQQHELFTTINTPDIELMVDGQQFFVDYQEDVDYRGQQVLTICAIDTGDQRVNEWLNGLDKNYNEIVYGVEDKLYEEIEKQ